MSGSVNKVCLLGTLGRDPEARSLGNGQKVVNLRIATSERWRDKQSGEQKERTEWHSVVIFNENLADVAEKYLAKGRTVYLEGQLQTRKWTDQSGAEKFSTEVVLQRFRGELVLLGGGNRDEGERQQPERGERRGRMSEQRGAGGGYADLDDSIPFGPVWW